MRSSKLKFVLVFIFTVFMCANVHATDLQIHGFADIVGSQSGTDYSLHDIGNNGSELSFDPESRMGLNLSSSLGDSFVFAAQILARGVDKGAYKLSADWIFVTYKPTEHISLRFGKQANPVFLFSEQIDVGFTYLWVRLPYELYGYYPIKSFNGASLIYSMNAFGEYQFQAQILGGSSDINIERPTYQAQTRADRVRGINLSLTSDHSKIHLAYFADSSEGSFTNSSGTFNVDFGTIELYSLGTTFDLGKFIFFIEASKVAGDQASLHSSKSVYVSVGYEVTPQITPYITYSMADDIKGTVFTNPTISPATPTTTRDNEHSVMVGANYKVSPSMVVKGEYMRNEQEFVDTSKNFGANTFSASMSFIF